MVKNTSHEAAADLNKVERFEYLFSKFSKYLYISSRCGIRLTV